MSGSEVPRPNRERLAFAVLKADRFAEVDDKCLRSKAKQAIIQELNSEMQEKADRMRSKQRTQNDTAAGHMAVEGHGLLPGQHLSKKSKGFAVGMGPMGR